MRLAAEGMNVVLADIEQAPLDRTAADLQAVGRSAILPLLEASGEDHMINTASTAGLMASPRIAPDDIAKFGVVALTETGARELEARESPVGTSVPCPGAINTQIVFSDRNRLQDSVVQHAESTEEQQFKQRAAGLLANQGLRPQDVADMIVNAIRGRQLWILTHADWKRVMRPGG